MQHAIKCMGCSYVRSPRMVRPLIIVGSGPLSGGASPGPETHRVMLSYTFAWRYRSARKAEATRVTLSLGLREYVWGNSFMIRDFVTRWSWMVRFTLLPLYLRRKRPRCPLERRPGWSRNRSGFCGMETDVAVARHRTLTVHPIAHRYTDSRDSRTEPQKCV
jgi:hypothetical protein